MLALSAFGRTVKFMSNTMSFLGNTLRPVQATTRTIVWYGSASCTTSKRISSAVSTSGSGLGSETCCQQQGSGDGAFTRENRAFGGLCDEWERKGARCNGVAVPETGFK